MIGQPPDVVFRVFLPYVQEDSRMRHLIAFLKYISVVVVEGDWANDWITHLPEWVQPHLAEVGKFLATIIGS